jgi:hypothetical protein
MKKTILYFIIMMMIMLTYTYSIRQRTIREVRKDLEIKDIRSGGNGVIIEIEIDNEVDEYFYQMV